MSSQKPEGLPSDVEGLNEISVASWNENAAWWDDYMGTEGNDFFQVLEIPGVLRLADVKPGDRALDLATGNGLVAINLAKLGATVHATDGSEKMVENAKKRAVEQDFAGITFGVVDVTDPAALSSLSDESSDQGGFDVVTINMAIQDIPTLEPLAAALPRLLKRDGKFVASLCHPVFMTSGATRNVELGENQETGRFEVKHSINISRYLDIPPMKGEAMAGQPAVQIYFNRSLTELFRPFFAAGLLLDGIEEPSFIDSPMPEKVQSYHNFPQIPPVLIFRMRRST